MHIYIYLHARTHSHTHAHTHTHTHTSKQASKHKHAPVAALLLVDVEDGVEVPSNLLSLGRVKRAKAHQRSHRFLLVVLRVALVQHEVTRTCGYGSGVSVHQCAAHTWSLRSIELNAFKQLQSDIEFVSLPLSPHTRQGTPINQLADLPHSIDTQPKTQVNTME